MSSLPPILHFNTLAHGGAATAARKIHDSLVAGGFDSRFFFTNGVTHEPTYEQLRFKPRFGGAGRLWHGLFQRVRRRIEVDPSGLFEPFGWSTIPGLALDLTPADSPCILHLHWVVGLVDYRRFFSCLPNDVPIVWTLHDMNPVTGGCHYAWDCTGFVDDCDRCPQLPRLASSFIAKKSQQLRAGALSHRNLHIVADSHWLEGQAKRSRILQSARSFRTIHYGVDLEVFRPQDPGAAKTNLGIDGSRSVVAFGSGRLDTPRKGFSQLCVALGLIDRRDEIEVLTFGERGSVTGPKGVHWKHVGSIGSRHELATIYNAADLFVMPSLEEAFGQTGQEALACGTPVIAFEVGGVPDFVQPDRTGLLAEVGDVEHLAKHISDLAHNIDQRRLLGQNGRELMVSEFSLDRQRDRYLDLYREISDP